MRRAAAFVDESDHHALMYVRQGQVVREEGVDAEDRDGRAGVATTLRPLICGEHDVVVVCYCRTKIKAVRWGWGGEGERVLAASPTLLYKPLHKSPLRIRGH